MKRIFTASALILTFLFNTQSAIACGWDEDEWPHNFSFFNPTLLQAPELMPFQLTWHDLYEVPSSFAGEIGEWDPENSKVVDNIAEWNAYFKKKANPDHIEIAIYNWGQNDIRELGQLISQRKPLSPRWKKNSLAGYLHKTQNFAFLDYLYYVREAEPQAMKTDDWEGGHLQPEAVQHLLRKGKNNYQSIQDDFLKLRYGYQLVRLAQYTRQYQMASDLYDELVLPLQNVKSIIQDWTLSHKAGVDLRLGKEAESGYEFAQVFSRAPAYRVHAFRGFKIGSEESWNAAMALCKNKREQGNLYLMRGMNFDNNSVEEIENLIKIDPDHPLMDLLLVREVHKIEGELLS